MNAYNLKRHKQTHRMDKRKGRKNGWEKISEVLDSDDEDQLDWAASTYASNNSGHNPSIAYMKTEIIKLLSEKNTVKSRKLIEYFNKSGTGKTKNRRLIATYCDRAGIQLRKKNDKTIVVQDNNEYTKLVNWTDCELNVELQNKDPVLLNALKNNLVHPTQTVGEHSQRKKYRKRGAIDWSNTVGTYDDYIAKMDETRESVQEEDSADNSDPSGDQMMDINAPNSESE